MVTWHFALVTSRLLRRQQQQKQHQRQQLQQQQQQQQQQRPIHLVGSLIAKPFNQLLPSFTEFLFRAFSQPDFRVCA